MNYLTIAICGLSTKAVSQIRTHATRLTFMSTSTQYSSYEKRKNNWVLPEGFDKEAEEQMLEAYKSVENIYADLIRRGLDKDKVGYLLPQGLRKALIISGNLDDWRYVISLRLCHRNTKEVQHIMQLILKEITKECGKEYTIGMLPECVYGPCKEGKFCCGKKFIEEVNNMKDMKFDQEKPRMDLLPLDCMAEIAKILTFGAAKYKENSWQKLKNGKNRYKGAL